MTATVPEAAPNAAGPEREFTVESRSQARMILRRFLQHRAAVISGILLILAILVALIGGRLWHYRYDDFLPVDQIDKPPSLSHPMGTTSAGRDVFAQVLRGAQKSVQIALTVALVSTTLGVLIGAFAGFYRGALDSVLMRFTDLFLIIPPLIFFAMLGRKFAGSGWFALALCLAALSWTSIARVVRGTFLSLREKEYVEAARALGASNKRIIFKHLLPNTVGPIIVNATITVAVAILVETSLSYLGLGVQAPDTSLGKLISDNQQSAATRPWLFYFPGLYIILIALTVNFLGDGLRDAFDPTQRRVRA
jgi:ABC-type dipeptide/oligopeptide/nickel transport system permease subunit